MTNNEDFTPYAWDELAQQWEREEITIEQLSGQLLVWTRQLHGMLVACQREQEIMGHVLLELDEQVQAWAAQVS